MILQALNEQYKRLKDNPNEDVPLRGFSREKVQFELILNTEGQLLQINDLRDAKKAAKSIIVPWDDKRANDVHPYFLSDNTGYFLGRDNKNNPERAKKQFAECVKLHHQIGDTIKDDGMCAVLRFFDNWEPKNLEQSIFWQKWEDAASMRLVFRLDGERNFIHEREVLKNAWIEYSKVMSSDYFAQCLISGNKSAIARKHKSVQGVKDAQPTGADLVSFNRDSFCSYGKKQGFNAPISEEAMFNYTTVLNHMLRRESRQKIQIGDATTVFWAEDKTPVVGFLKDILAREDTPNLSELRLFLEAVRDGKNADLPEDQKNLKFYILGLAPNIKRLSVRFWHISTVEDISKKIGQHCSDLRILREPEEKQPEYPGIWRLLRVTAVRDKTKNILPLLAGAVMRSILTGAAYPRLLLTATIERIRAEQNVGYFRAALIKAYLVRNNRLLKQNAKEVCMSLDKEQRDVGYLLGRLFAVLEKIQGEAHGKATIRERYYGSASSTPVVAFSTLMKLKNHHLGKLDNKGRVIYFERIIGEILNDVSFFPSHLRLEEQGMFALGFYHQNIDL